MKRLKLLGIALALLPTLGANAQTGSEPAEGRFLLYNVGAQQYLNSGENWQTHATLDDYGMYVTLASSGSGYSLSTAETYSGTYLGSNAYVDNGTACEWDFTAVEGLDNTYTINNDGNYLVYNSTDDTQQKVILTTTAPTDNNGYWKLVSQEDFEANVMSQATATSPVNVSSYMINGEFLPYALMTSYQGTGFTNTGSSFSNSGYRVNAVGNSSNLSAEQYNKVFDTYQTLTVPNGKYKVTASGFYTGDNPAYVYGNDVKAAFNTQDGDTDGYTEYNNHSGAPLVKAAYAFGAGYYVTTTDTIYVTDSTLQVGVTSNGLTCTWCPFDKFKIEYFGKVDLSAYITAYKSALAAANTVYSGSDDMLESIKTSLGTIIDTYSLTKVDTTNQTELETATAALEAITAKADSSIASYKILDTGSLTDGDLTNWTCSNSNTFHSNTWSTEADNTGMTKPFIENWVASGSYLGDGKITYTLPYVESGYYKVSALVRVYSEAGNIPSGASWYGGDNSTDIASTGTAVTYGTSDQGFYGTYTTIANVGDDNTLTFGVSISSANFNWVAIKNVTIEKLDGDTVTIDESEDYSPIAATGATVTLERTFNANAWNTLILPCAVSSPSDVFGSGVQVYEYTGTTDAGTGYYTLNFTSASSIEANKPYFVYGTTADQTEWTISNVDLVVPTDTIVTDTNSGFNFVGVYKKTTVPADSWFIASDNSFYKSTGSTTIKPTRAYFAPASSEAAKAGIFFDGVEDNTTGISAIDGQVLSTDKVYNIQGQQVNNDYKGIIIVNGKKYINK